MEHGVHCDRISNNDRLFRVSNRNEQRKSAFPLMHACLILSQNRIFERKNNCSKFDGSESYRYMVWYPFSGAATRHQGQGCTCQLRESK